MGTGEGTRNGHGRPEANIESEAALIALVHEAHAHIKSPGPETEAWLSKLEEHHHALHQLVERLLATRPEKALELGARLWPFWWHRGHMAEGRTFLQRLSGTAGAARSDALKGLGTIAFRQGDAEVAEEAFRTRLELVERDGTKRDLADALADLARIALRRGDFASVRRYAEQGFAAAQGLEPQAIRMPLHMRAAAARMEHRLEEARALYLESRELNDRLGNAVNVAGEDHNLFYVALHSGDRDEAERRFRLSSEWIFAHDNAYLRPYAFLDAGILALHKGELQRAGRLVACAQRIFDDTDAIPDPDDRVELDEAVVRLKHDLGQRFDSIWAEGQALSREEAQALARA